MKFLCLSYLDETKFEVLSESERESFVKECSAYDDMLRKNGHFIRLEALRQCAERQNAALPRRQSVRHRWTVR